MVAYVYDLITRATSKKTPYEQMLLGLRALGMMYISIFMQFLSCITALDSMILIWGNGVLPRSKNIGPMHLSTKLAVTIPS
jgi:hypothetical protein